MGLGGLSKYTAFFQWLCWACVFALIPPARKQLRRPGFYLALAVNLLCLTPVVIWNAQHGWISVVHTAERGNLGDHWQPTLKYFFDFIGGEALLFNPVFFVAIVWTFIAWWRRRNENSLLTYFICMGAPVFLFYLVWTFHSRVLPNWIAPSILPLLCAATLFWHARASTPALKRWLAVGLGLGFFVVILLHDTTLVQKFFGRALPEKVDQMPRVQGWRETADTVAAAREKLLGEGKPVFIIGEHYGIASQVAFNMPAARAVAASPAPLVFCIATAKPDNQFYFWPSYVSRHGDNALYVRRVDNDTMNESPAPPELAAQFQSVASLGLFDVRHNDRLVRRLQLFACRGLR
jgi:hypothetical protein